MKNKNTFICNEKDKGKRLDIFLMEKSRFNRSEIKKMIDKNLILLNKMIPKKAGQILKENDGVEILESVPEEADAENNIKIIADTGDFVVIDKPAGLLVHETDSGEANTLTAWLLQKYPKIKNVGENKTRPGIVHRLDKDASGVMVIAKNEKMFGCLKKQFQERTVEKEYLALVHGRINTEHDLIDFDIDRSFDGRMAARPKIDLDKLKNVGKKQPGREAITEFWISRKFARFTLLKVKIHTGRTHQIRVHMLAYGNPLVGDKLYFNKKLNRKRDKELGRMFLHSEQLCFYDLAGDKVCYKSELPKKLKDFLKILN